LEPPDIGETSSNFCRPRVFRERDLY
jgi:hypothetical protein